MPLVHPMRKPHAPAGFLLGEPQATHCPSDFNHQTRLDLELVGVGQVEVGEYVARPGFDLDAIN